MIDDKKIEGAARRYSKVTDCDKEEALLIEEGFKEGAEWAINEFLKDLWHQTNKEPEGYDEWILLHYSVGKYRLFEGERIEELKERNIISPPLP